MAREPNVALRPIRPLRPITRPILPTAAARQVSVLAVLRRGRPASKSNETFPASSMAAATRSWIFSCPNNLPTSHCR